MGTIACRLRERACGARAKEKRAAHCVRASVRASSRAVFKSTAPNGWPNGSWAPSFSRLRTIGHEARARVDRHRPRSDRRGVVDAEASVGCRRAQTQVRREYARARFGGMTNRRWQWTTGRTSGQSNADQTRGHAAAVAIDPMAPWHARAPPNFAPPITLLPGSYTPPGPARPTWRL